MNPPPSPQCALESTYRDGDRPVCADCRTGSGSFLLKADFLRKV
jgi:uncharacterized Zn ribbon protein